jgi:hypothetical protein
MAFPQKQWLFAASHLYVICALDLFFVKQTGKCTRQIISCGCDTTMADSITKLKFYAYHSVRRESISKNSDKMTALYSTLLFPVSRCAYFGHIPCPSSGAQ